jgi:pimeloyl-ACP methyl ester carboxylesterase
MNVNTVLTPLAVLALGLSLWNLHAASAGTTEFDTRVGATPVRIYRPSSATLGPVVVIAHGFAGSQQIMQSFALTFARNGYIAVTFDFPGHGRNPVPLTGSITDVNGASRTLLATLTEVANFARSLGDGRIAVLGHSMASDIVIRYAESQPAVTATIAVSMFSPAVTASAPHNLLIVVGSWESMLKREALRAVGLTTAPATALPGVTYGQPALGTGRKAVFSPGAEHISVLYNRYSLRESLDWLDRSFAIRRTTPPKFDTRGPWILTLIAGVVMLARPLSSLLPKIANLPLGAGLPWRRLWLAMLIPMLLTPLLLRVLPTHFLPVLVGDYLAVHFAAYGLISAGCLAWMRRETKNAVAPQPLSPLALVVAAAAIISYQFIGLVVPINTYVTSFYPGYGRIALLIFMLLGTLPFFLSDEWLTRGQQAATGSYLVSKLAFLLSLALAVALDFERLFFLIIIVPVIVLFFLIYGLFSAWSYQRTGHPLVAAIANAIAFAWAISVTFPLLAG